MSATIRTVPVASDRVDAIRPGTLILLRLLLLARVVWVPLVAYTTSVISHLTILWAMTGPGQIWGTGLRDKLTSWDGRLLLQIAQHGYPDSFTYGSDGKLTGNNLAFSPLYPMTVRVVHWITGLDYPSAGLLTAHLAFFLLLVTVNSLVVLVHSRKTATIAVFLLAGAQPMGTVFLMSYSESLFTALSAAVLLALYRRHWITAGILASLAGLTRPVGIAVTVTLAVTVVFHLISRRRFEARPVTGLVLGSLGLPLYLGWVGMRVGVLNAWFTIQEAGWGTHWDNGRSSFEFLRTAFIRSDSWVMISTAVLVTIISTITLSSWRSTWIPIAIYGTLVLVMTFGQSNYYHCKLRLLVPVIAVVIPVARALSGAKRSTQIVCVVLATAFSAWYGAYMLTVWHYAI